MSNAEEIARLNDLWRKKHEGNGRLNHTHGIKILPEHDKQEIHRLVREFDDFHEGNDPHGEHDWATFEYKNYTINWKIDYYDLTLEQGSEDPSDPEQTIRVLTVMLASEQ